MNTRFPTDTFRAVLLVTLSALMISCGGSKADSGDAVDAALAGENLAERDQALYNLQETLLGDSAVSAADALIRNAQRERTVADGLIREAVDYSPLSIQYYRSNPSDVMQSAIGRAEEGRLEIVDFGPSGRLPVENRRPSIYVMFNKPMVPLSRLGAPILESDLLVIDPPIDGVYRWQGTKTLAFRPRNPMQDRPKYSVSVPQGISALDGTKLKETLSFDIFGETVKMVNMFPGNDADTQVNLYDVPTALARRLTLEFNQDVDPETVAESIQVLEGSTPVPFSVERPDYPERLASRLDRGILLTLEREPRENSNYKVILGAGARPFPGYPETDQPQTYRMWTIRPFELERLSAYSSSFPRDNRQTTFPVYLRFSHPLEEGLELPEFAVTVDGKPIVPAEAQASWSTVALRLEHVGPGSRVEVRVPPGIRDIHGREIQGARDEVTIPRPDPLVDFPSHYDGLMHLEAEFEPAVVWLSRNVVQGTFGIAGRKSYYGRADFQPPSEPLDFSSIAADTTYFHQENLSPYLNGGRGTVFLSYRMRKDPAQVPAERQWSEGELAVQVTDMGLTVRLGYNKALVWVNTLSEGQPVPDAAVDVFNLLGQKYTGTTDADGLAVIPIPPDDFARHFFHRSNTRDDSVHIRARKGTDIAELRLQNTHNSYPFGVYNTVQPQDAADEHHRIHQFTDRGLYKGGEELALRGIHWIQDPSGFRPYVGRYLIRILEASSGEELWRQTGKTSASGGYSHRLVLPDDLDPGAFSIEYSGTGFRGSTEFRVAAFRRVNFQVTSRTVEPEYFHGDTVEASVAAANLAGGAMPSAPYHYYWTRQPIRFVPPGSQWSQWTFGTSDWAGEQTLSSGDGSLSGAGSALISEGTINHEVTGKAYRYTLETSVEDVDRQVVSSLASAVVHPADAYIAARFDQGTADGWWTRFVSTGDEQTVVVKLAAPSGEELPLQTPITMGLIRGEWKSASQQGLYGRINTRWEYVEEELWREDTAPGVQEARKTFIAEESGRHTLFFEYVDGAGRTARTEIEFYATGSGWVRQASRTPQDINLIVDKDIYEPGDTARILVQSPVPQGRYLLTLERNGILDERIISLEGSTEVIDIPIRDEYLPVFYVALTSFTERTETEDDYFKPDLGKPRDLFGLTTVHVATTPMELNVTATSVAGNYGPGDEAEIEVLVTKDGRPVADAEVTLLAVDRGVLDLIDYHIPDPLTYFYDEEHFPLGTMGDDSRRLLLRPVTYEISDLQGGGGSKLEERRDFNPLALFEPALITDEEGKVRVKTALPDTLTTYRITAVALEGTRLGLDEDEFMVSNPVNVRTALPRRFRNRDSVAAGVVLTNTTENEVTLTVAAESDILDIAGDDTKTVRIPGSSALELPFLLEAREKGEGTIRFTITGEVLNEVLVDTVAVDQPLVTEAITTIGVLNDTDAATETVVLPRYGTDGYGGLSLRIESSVKPYVRESLDQILSVPYPSLNQKLYRTMAEIVDHGQSEQASGVFRELAARQFEDGGIGYHPPAGEYARPHWFLSCLAAHVAAHVTRTDANFENPLDMDALHHFIGERLEEAMEKDRVTFLAAWSVRILAEHAGYSPDAMAWLFNSEDRLGLAGMNLLSGAYAALGEQRQAQVLYDRSKNFMTMGTQTISLSETYEKNGYFSSGETELALFLDTALSRGEPEELIMRIASSLDQNRHQRRFRSQFDDFWVLNGFLGLLDRESHGSGGVAVTLAGQSLVETQVPAGSALSIDGGFPLNADPLAGLETGVPLDLNVRKTGENPIYYAATLRYALPAETALPRDEGFEVTRRFETLDGEILDPGALPLGETLRVRVNLSTLNRRSFVNLVVPIPSGAEVVDASFATTGSFGDRGGTGSETWERETVYGDTAEFIADGSASYGRDGWEFWFYRPMQTIYDNAVTYGWEDFYSGQREISFLIRTTTPGIFPTPPASVSGEFEPEVFGRSEGSLAVILAQ